jgi:hypothetical protein
MTVPWSPAFPTPFSLPWYKFHAVAKDELGNDVPKWDDAQWIPVQGWDMMTSEKLAEHEAEEDFDAFVLTPAEFWLGIQDRVGLPLPENGMSAPATVLDVNGNLNKGIFEVIGHDIESYGPQLWTPGNVSLLKVVEG